MSQPPTQGAPAPDQQTPPTGGGAMEPHRGTMILIFGILGIVCCLIFGIVAWVMGQNDLKKMDAGQMDPSGRGMTNAGRILGIVGVVLQIVGFVINLLVGGLAILGGSAAG